MTFQHETSNTFSVMVMTKRSMKKQREVTPKLCKKKKVIFLGKYSVEVLMLVFKQLILS